MSEKVLEPTTGGGMLFHCPGCKMTHVVYVERRDGPVWGFNGSLERPTFTPSVLVRYELGHPPVTSENIEEYKRSPWPQTRVKTICHSFITDGKIQYLGDCTHELAGKTVPVPVWDEELF